MRRITNIASLIVVALLLSGGAAGQQKPINWALKLRRNTRALKPGGEFTVQVTAQIKEGWHVYATSQPRGGPVATKFTLPPGQPFKLNGFISAPAPLTAYDAAFDKQVKFYENTVTFLLPLQVAADAPAGRHLLAVVIAYQSCSKEVCFPVKRVQLSDEIEVVSGSAPAEQVRLSAARPRPLLPRDARHPDRAAAGGREAVCLPSDGSNKSARTVTAIAWDYVFIDPTTQAEVGRHQFQSRAHSLRQKEPSHCSLHRTPNQHYSG